MSIRRYIGWILGGSMLLLGATASAVPSSITYTGELMADNGLPYTGSVSVVATLFDAETAGQQLWQQDLGQVAVFGGVLRAELMGDATLWGQLYDNDAAYIEFTIDGETLSPRQALTTAPYAAVAGNAQMLGGMTASQLVAQAGSGPIDPADLPDDGIDDLSNGAISNQFIDVMHEWTTGDTIPDFEAGAPPETALAQAEIAIDEAPSTYMYGLKVQTNFTLTVQSTVTMVLYPPAATGLGPITLVDAMLLSPATYAQPWTPADTPALTNLLGKSPGGTWALTITDTDNTLAGNGSVGTLSSFKVEYDVVREDHLAVSGRLDVNGDANIYGNLTVTEGFITPALPVTVYRFEGASTAAVTDHSQLHGGAQITFTLDRPKMVQFHFDLGGNCDGASYVGALLKLNGSELFGTANIDTCQTYWNVDGTRTQIVPAGTHTVGIYAGRSGGSPVSYNDIWRTRHLEVVVFGKN